MAQFDVYQTPHPYAPLVIDIQTELLRYLKTRVVIPLEPVRPGQAPHLSRLHPVIAVSGTDYVLNTAELAAIDTAQLIGPVASLEATHRQIIVEALDFLVHGY
jgi:hypothetical protein